MKKSSYWSEMFISNGNSEDGFIISYDRPIGFDDNDKKFLLYEGIKESEYEEVSSFYGKYNRTSTGNITLLLVDDLKRYLSLNNITILMRSSNGMLIGSIISLLVPIKIDKSIIVCGCTTFLAVHPALRKMGLCMALIRKLIEIAYERKIYCDYHIVSFPIGSNSISINSWYRPINLKKSKELGFMFEGCMEDNNSTKTRLKYNNNLPNNYSYKLIDNIDSLNYINNNGYRFSFAPDLELWTKWTKVFPTYVVYKLNKIIGIISINTVYCMIENNPNPGRILFPIFYTGENECMKILCAIGKELKHDVLYFHQHGDIDEKALKSINAIKTNTTLFFSLYNNSIKLKAEDLHIPLL